MIDVLKALLWVIVAAFMRFLGLTQPKKRAPVRFVGTKVKTRDGTPVEGVGPPRDEQRKAVEQANSIVAKIVSINPLDKEEEELVLMATHIMAGLVDQPGVTMRCHFQFLPDQKVLVDFLAEDTLSGQPITVQMQRVHTNVLSLKGRDYLADYIKGLIEFQAQKDRVTAAMRLIAPNLKGGTHDQEDRPDEDENRP